MYSGILKVYFCGLVATTYYCIRVCNRRTVGVVTENYFVAAKACKGESAYCRSEHTDGSQSVLHIHVIHNREDYWCDESNSFHLPLPIFGKCSLTSLECFYQEIFQ